MNDENRDVAVQLFRKLQSRFPNLSMHLDLDPDHVEVSLDIPKQNGLLFDISLNLQNSDELHLNAGALWQEWFPCSDETISQQYFEAITGLLSGSNRILQHCRGRKVVKAELQQPNGSRWETIATWSCLHLPVPFMMKMTELRNAQQAHGADAEDARF
jgi:hypothetical protein